ncbi:hypothetical protein IWX49DRAFT_434340 [Phyllosticta citricarpa]
MGKTSHATPSSEQLLFLLAVCASVWRTHYALDQPNTVSWCFWNLSNTDDSFGAFEWSNTIDFGQRSWLKKEQICKASNRKNVRANCKATQHVTRLSLARTDI